MKWIKRIALAITALVLVGFIAVCWDEYSYKKRNEEAEAAYKKKFNTQISKEILRSELSALPTRYIQDGKMTVFITELDQTRPIWWYDIENNILLGVSPGIGHTFIAERKAIPVNQ